MESSAWKISSLSPGVILPSHGSASLSLTAGEAQRYRLEFACPLRRAERQRKGFEAWPEWRGGLCTTLGIQPVLTDHGLIPCVQDLPQNQCIFVRGFRILNLWPRLRGAGPAPDFGEREPESDRRLELISIPADIDVCSHYHYFLTFADVSKYQDPLHILSAHISEVSTIIESPHVDISV